MRRIHLVTLAAATLLAAGCDEFDLLDQFLPDGGLVLEAERTTILQGDEVALIPQGGTEPYEYSVVADDIKDSPSDDSPVGTITDNTFTAGNEVGMVVVTLTDASGFSTDLELTIMPEPPVLSRDSIETADPVELSWTVVGAEYVSYYVLERSRKPDPYAVLWTSLSAATLNYSDGAVVGPKDYDYRVYAVAVVESGDEYWSEASNEVYANP